MIKIYVRFSIRTCKEGNNKISSFSKVTDVPQMSFLKFAKQEIAHAHKIGCYSMARNYGTAIRSFKKQYTHLGSVVILGGLTFVNFPLCIHLC